MLVRHINVAFGPTGGGRVYCYKYSEQVVLDEVQWARCHACQYFDGSHQGDGVVCAYNDVPTPGEPEFDEFNNQIAFYSAPESERWTQLYPVRQGYKTVEEVMAAELDAGEGKFTEVDDNGVPIHGPEPDVDIPTMFDGVKVAE